MRAPLTRYGLPLGLVVLLACLPLLDLSLPGVLPGPTYTPGSLHLMALAMVMAARGGRRSWDQTTTVAGAGYCCWH